MEEETPEFTLFLHLGEVYLKVKTETDERNPVPPSTVLFKRNRGNDNNFTVGTHIEFPLRRLKRLEQLLDRLDIFNIQDEWQKHVGGQMYLSSAGDLNGVKLFDWILREDGDIEPGVNGFDLTLDQIDKLKHCLHYLKRTVLPELHTTVACADQRDHQNFEGALACLECYPF